MGLYNFIRKRISCKTILGTIFLFSAMICFFYMLPLKITKEGMAKGQPKNAANAAKVDKIIKGNTSRIGSLEKTAKGQNEKVTTLQRQIKKLKKDMAKTANQSATNINKQDSK